MSADAIVLRPKQPAWPVPLRFALRELRGGLRGFYVFLACIALGVMAIAGVGSIAESLTGGLAREGRVILGGDVSFSIIHRQLNAAERAFLNERGVVSEAATMRAMARTAAGETALVEVKAVDANYPLYGTIALDPPSSLVTALAPQGDVFGAAADPALLVRLAIEPGNRVTIGSATFEIRAAVASEPDKLAGGIGFGPRLFMTKDALVATGLVQPGSLVRWHYRLRVTGNDAGDARIAALIDEANRRFPDAGWEIRSRSNASPQLERSVERFTQYLTLVGLTALLVGGIGVANAVNGHLERKRESIATMKALGATGGRVFAIYLAQVTLLAAFGTGLGLVLGAALPFALAHWFAPLLPLPIEPALYPSQLLVALVYGLLTALAFALWPLGRAHDIPVSALFRDAIMDERRWPRRRYIAAAAIVVVALVAIAVALAYDRRIAVIFVGASATTFVALHLIAQAVMTVARRLPHARAAVVQFAIANIHRPGALTPTVVLLLGLGVALLVTIVEIDGNLRQQFISTLPARAPAFFFLDIQSNDADRFEAIVRAQAPGTTVERAPMLRGRIVAANGTRAEDLKPSPTAAWALQSDRGVTFTRDLPAGSRVVEGQWWPASYDGPPLLSMEKRVADGLGLKLGDLVTVNVFGRNITAPIANMRAVDWQSLGINFVLVYSPGAFRGAPHTEIATLTYPSPASVKEENALLQAVSEAMPAITAIRVKDALEAVAAIVTNLILAIRAASAVSLLAAVLVLAGALAASHHNRVYDAVVLKMLGATRRQLISTFAIEYLLLGAVAAGFGVAAGCAAAWMVMTQVMNVGFVLLAGPALVAATAAVLATVAFGLIGTFGALSQKPAPILRNL